MPRKYYPTVSDLTCMLLACACIAAGGRAAAAVVSPTASVTVTDSNAYTSYNGGDFIFFTSAAASGCEAGWYIKSTDPGYKTAVAVVLAAQLSGNFVLVRGDNSDLWSGSPGSHICHAITVGISS
jgi:hypothetical protein